MEGVKAVDEDDEDEERVGGTMVRSLRLCGRSKTENSAGSVRPFVSTCTWACIFREFWLIFSVVDKVESPA